MLSQLARTLHDYLHDEGRNNKYESMGSEVRRVEERGERGGDR